MDDDYCDFLSLTTAIIKDEEVPNTDEVVVTTEDYLKIMTLLEG